MIISFAPEAEISPCLKEENKGANYCAALDAGRTFFLHIARPRPGASERGVKLRQSSVLPPCRSTSSLRSLSCAAE
jgi:hypothetical protein